MSDAPLDFNSLFALSSEQLDVAAYERYADLVYGSALARNRFEDALRARRPEFQAGQTDPFPLAVALLLAGSYGESLEWFSKSGETKARHYFSGEALLALNRFGEAAAAFQKAAAAGWDELAASMRAAHAHLRAGDVQAASKLVDRHERGGRDRADWYFINGLLKELSEERESASEDYDKAITLSPGHLGAMFRAAYLADLYGDDNRAVELYEQLAHRPAAHVNALINLAVLYEDRGKYDAARDALRRVLSTHPNHARARLFYRDAESSRHMVIDDTLEKRSEVRNRVLEMPITEFDLTVRTRNALRKMRIQTLGDLLKLTEEELMAYKSFGDSSLNEVKALLAKRGLRLGQKAEEAAPEPDPTSGVLGLPKLVVPAGSEALLGKPVSELELSVRARRCLQRLNIATLGELIQHSEAELLGARNFGTTSLNEVKSRLAEHGLSLPIKQT